MRKRRATQSGCCGHIWNTSFRKNVFSSTSCKKQQETSLNEVNPSREPRLSPRKLRWTRSTHPRNRVSVPGNFAERGQPTHGTVSQSQETSLNEANPSREPCLSPRKLR